MDWLAKSHGFNPVENMWAILGDKIKKQDNPPKQTGRTDCGSSGGVASHPAETHQDSLQFHEEKMCEVCAEQRWTYQPLSL